MTALTALTALTARNARFCSRGQDWPSAGYAVTGHRVFSLDGLYTSIIFIRPGGVTPQVLLDMGRDDSISI